MFMARDAKTDKNVAVKVIRYDKLHSAAKGAAMLEAEYYKMKIFEGHPNILQGYFCNTKGTLQINGDWMGVMYSVIELAENGNLANIIRYTGGLGEEFAKFYFIQICHAINYIHYFGIAHMDIKLENILLDRYFNAKVADFGVSVDVSQTGGLSNRVRGTYCYMAPEIVGLIPSDTYDVYKADIYSLGMWLYVMLFGEFPLKEDSETCSNFDSETIGWITGLKWSTEIKKLWDLASLDLQDLLSSMLWIDPDERPTISEILEWEWFKSNDSDNFSQKVYEEMEHRKNYVLEHYRQAN